jgi:hypothetical protein
MTGFTIEFSPWGKFHAKKDKAEIRSWLNRVGEASVEAFKGGMGSGGPSAPGAWPNSQTGRLKGSISHRVSSDSVTVGSGMPYSIFLRTGTSKMARRKMSDDALKEGMQAGRLGKWVHWSRG